MIEYRLSTTPCAYRVSREGDMVIVEMKDELEEIRVSMTSYEANRFVSDIMDITWRIRNGHQ